MEEGWDLGSEGTAGASICTNIIIHCGRVYDSSVYELLAAGSSGSLQRMSLLRVHFCAVQRCVGFVFGDTVYDCFLVGMFWTASHLLPLGP